jgi:hypothetical protein
MIIKDHIQNKSVQTAKINANIAFNYFAYKVFWNDLLYSRISKIRICAYFWFCEVNMCLYLSRKICAYFLYALIVLIDWLYAYVLIQNDTKRMTIMHQTLIETHLLSLKRKLRAYLQISNLNHRTLDSGVGSACMHLFLGKIYTVREGMLLFSVIRFL